MFVLLNVLVTFSWFALSSLDVCESECLWHNTTESGVAAATVLLLNLSHENLSTSVTPAFSNHTTPSSV